MDPTHRAWRAHLVVAALVAAGCTVEQVALPVAGGDAAADAPVCPMVSGPRRAAGEGCVCDTECAGNACVLGLCCEGPSCARRPEGAGCRDDSMCSSGFCVDGVCCNVPCTGGCAACNVPGNVGECSLVPAGAPDPHGRCRHDPPESCGESGLCNGQGACMKHEAGTTCRTAGCADGRTLRPAAACDGRGQCLEGASIDCAPWTCNGGACRTTCAADGECTAPAQCLGGACGKFAPGSRCTGNDECLSGACADGVCCDSPCAGRCTSCALPGSLGHCAPVPAGSPDPRAGTGEGASSGCVDQGPASCGSNGRCDGKGGCQVYPEGTACRAASCDPASNSATPAGACRNGACAAASAQSCAPFQGCQGDRCATFCASDGQCAMGSACQNGSCGRRPVGAACARGEECAGPGICAQGRCCTTACDGVCQSCDLPGSAGTCRMVAAGGADPGGRCQNDACSNGCDGNGHCQQEPVGTSCKAPSCMGGGAVQSFTCTAAGTCQAHTAPCGPGESCDPKSGACQSAGGAPGQSCGGKDGPCRSGLSCVQGICCMGSGCGGPCLTGACRPDGSGCAARPAGTDCGTACAGMGTVSHRTCNASGACVTSAEACPAGQTCHADHCQDGGGGGGGTCGNGCDPECTILDLLGACLPAPDGTACHGQSGMTCQKCKCKK
jgi:hypothetical protein